MAREKYETPEVRYIGNLNDTAEKCSHGDKKIGDALRADPEVRSRKAYDAKSD